MLGAIAQFEKASSVAKLAAARKRKREREGRCEGRKPLSQTRPEVVALARKLRRRRPKGGQLSLREVSKELAARGYLIYGTSRDLNSSQARGSAGVLP